MLSRVSITPHKVVAHCGGSVAQSVAGRLQNVKMTFDIYGSYTIEMLGRDPTPA